MVQNNKVLTVSYGTFSCTLEGFEDSFDTMKAIAEYFRDLAADDRYFGAEPPQPDAEMLARIAQKEIARQVEARTSDEGIHLRAAVPAPAQAPVDAPAVMAEPAPTAPPQHDVRPDAQPDAAESPTEAPLQAEDTAEGVAVAEIGTETADAAADKLPVSSETAPDLEPEEESAVAQVEAAPETATEERTEDRAENADVAVEEAVQPSMEAEFQPETPAEPQAEPRIESKAEAQTEPATELSAEDDAPIDSGSDTEAAAWGVEAALTDASAAADDEHIVIPDVEEEPVPVAQSIAAKLQRIRAVVAKAPASEEDFNEDQHADPFGAGSDFLEETVRDLEDVLGDEGEDTVSDDAALPEDTQSASDILDHLPSGAEPEVDLDSMVAEIAAASESTTETTETDASAESLIEDTIAAALGQDAAVEDTAQQTPDGSPDLAPEALIEAAGEPKATTAAEPEPQPEAKAEPAQETTQTGAEKLAQRRPRGRIIRVRRAAADPNLVETTAEEVQASADTAPAAEPVAAVADTLVETPHPEAAQRSADSTLSDEDEADLMAELAAVEADLMAASKSSEPQEAEEVQTPSATGSSQSETVDDVLRGLEVLETSPTAETAPQRVERQAVDSDLSRLMAAADDKLEEAEATSSRETYNQLRAAVAAAQAEKGQDLSAQDSEAQAYREDLESVVRPRRPLKSRQAEAPRAARPEDSARAAPLKLVAEQRIDPADVPEAKPEVAQVAAEVAEAPSKPVQPRRVSRGMLGRKTAASAQETKGFSEFVREQGAVELGELLEAAATYLTQIEGRGQFTRPQLLGKVRDLDNQAGLTREDSLRAFGQLLREGKLDKAENGRFTTTSQTGFQPSTQVAG